MVVKSDFSHHVKGGYLLYFGIMLIDISVKSANGFLPLL